MHDGDDDDHLAIVPVENAIRKSTKQASAKSAPQWRSRLGIFTQSPNRVLKLAQEVDAEPAASMFIELRRLDQLCIRRIEDDRSLQPSLFLASFKTSSVERAVILPSRYSR